MSHVTKGKFRRKGMYLRLCTNHGMFRQYNSNVLSQFEPIWNSTVLRNEHAILPKREHTHVAPQMRRCCAAHARRCWCYVRLLIWLLLSGLFARFLLVVCFSLLSFVAFLFLLFSVLLFSLFLLLSFLWWEKPKVTRLAHSRLELVVCQSC